jgi:hypothetical protein
MSLNDLANPETSAPTRVVSGTRGPSGTVEQLGLWDLTGSEVRVRVPGGPSEGLRFFRPAAGASSWPQPPRAGHDPEAWRDLRYVPSMATLLGDGRIDPALVVEDGSANRSLPRSVAARVHLDGGLIEGAIPSQASYRDQVFEFRVPGSDRVLRQAMTDTMRWTLRADATAVVIEIVPVGGGQPKQLLLAPSATMHDAFISNLPAENPAHAAHATLGAEEMAALHFGAYYSLLLTKPADRPVPVPRDESAGRKAAGLIRPASCHAAIFTRQ